MITTAEEMMVAFLHGINREDADGVPYDKFNNWINKAQEDWLTERSNQFDTMQKRIDDLFILREERIINCNGSKTISANISIRLLSDGSGTLQVTEERYFNVSGLSFYKKVASAGVIDVETGEVTGAIIGDIFYALISYSELPSPIVSKVTIGATLASTHTGTKVAQTTGYATFLTDTSYPSEGFDSTPDESFTDYRFLVPNGFPNPRYFRLLNVMFQITYVDNELFEDGTSGWLKAKIMRADQRDAIMRNPIFRPSDQKPYYRFIGDFIELITESTSTPLKMKIEYLRYPVTIRYVEPDSEETAVDCELHPIQQKEIVDLAIRLFIEATKDPRYETQIAETQIRKQSE